MEIKTLYSEKEIKRRVNELGGQLTKDYKGKRPIVVGILKGSVIFLSDLVRAMDTELELDFMAVSSYGDERKSSGAVNIDKDLSRSIEGRHVLVVEDIVDSGLTLSYLLSFLKDRSPASLKLVTLLDKKGRREVEIEPDYTAFKCDNLFVVGYGLDDAQLYRNLPYIGYVEE
ncbi:MAG: hypoxanthine phosphoribosyltransferase [Oscillospiraceae bacterium]|nr:hypoxanthine phosphoribosyltransferase [Oscillospiraceae bacterium]